LLEAEELAHDDDEALEPPTERRLVHGGFGYGNVLVHHHAVAAVLDWQDARYGDPLFDLAYMVFFREAPVAAKMLEAYQSQTHGSQLFPENFAARLACYQYYIGLDSMRFAAKTNNPGFYAFVLEKLKHVTV
jgi:hygromycin-B 4-O-kinase